MTEIQYKVTIALNYLAIRLRSEDQRCTTFIFSNENERKREYVNEKLRKIIIQIIAHAWYKR